MASIAPTSIKTGRRSEHRESFAQLGFAVVYVNGWESNQVFSIKNGTNYDAGIDAPGAAPTGASSAGDLTGDYRYRVRFVDALTGTISLPSAELSVSLSAQRHTITRPAYSNARITHWILERTTDGEEYFYPVNRNSSNPWGTQIGTSTYEDNTEDDIISAREVIQNVQGVFKPFKFVFPNGPRLLFGGEAVHRPTVTLTNGSRNITSADGGFNAHTVGKRLAVIGETVSYEIDQVTDANTARLSGNYAGSTGAKVVAIAGFRNRVGWCESNEPEHGGSAEIGVLPLSNEQLLGDGAPVTGGVGLGTVGALWAKETQLHLHRYTIDPKGLIGDGQLQQLQTNRGTLNDRSLKFVDGYAYSIDYQGMWRMAPGGESLPDEIGAAIGYDFQINNLNFAKAENWIVAHDPFTRQVVFFVCEGSDTYPKLAYVWDLTRSAWVGTKTFPAGVTAVIQLPDINGAMRLCYYTEVVGNAPARLWHWEYGTTLGADPSSTLAGTVTSGGASTLTDSAANFYPADQKLKAVEVLLTRLADGSTESKLIADNTDKQLTGDSAWSTQPVAGDTYQIGPIRAKWQTGRINCGDSSRKKKFLQLWVWVKNGSTVPFYVKAYYNGSQSPYTYPTAFNEDGVTIVANTTYAKITPSTSGQHRFKVPLFARDENDVKLEIYSNDAGEPWEIMDLILDYEIDEAQKQRLE